MDWIDTQQTPEKKSRKSTSRTPKRSVNLEKRVMAALANPAQLWAEAFEQQLAGLEWPEGCDAQLTWLWSTVLVEQAQVLCRCGVSPSRLEALVKEANGFGLDCPVQAVSELMNEPLDSLAFQWLDQADSYPQAALGVIATAWNLPQHARRIDGEKLGKWLAAVARRTVEHSNQQSDCLLGNLAFHCELPLLLDLLTASPKFSAGPLSNQAMDDLAEYLENSQEHMGSWLAHGAAYLRAALACVLRCRLLADHMGLRSWYEPQRKALAGILSHAARWSRPDGSQMLGHARGSKESMAVWKALTKRASINRKQRQQMVLSNLLKGKRPSAKDSPAGRFSDLAANDEQAACAIMGSSWLQPSSRLAVDFSESTGYLEALGPKGRALLGGNWPVQVTEAGNPAYQLDGWEQLCWFSDQDIDYLEIEARFGEFAKVQRQIILFRKQRFLLAADALICEQPGQWSMTSRMPLADQVQWQAGGKNTEGFLLQGKNRCLVIPLFLPEWKAATTVGSIDVESNQLVITNSSLGASRIYSPVLVSLCNRIAAKPYTWRQLTVADNLRIVARDEAAGYRLQLGKQQFLLYRSLAKPTRRTLLGAHLMSDFFAGSFEKDSGEAETLVEIEGSS
jgi:hypothetical protein